MGVPASKNVGQSHPNSNKDSFDRGIWDIWDAKAQFIKTRFFGKIIITGIKVYKTIINIVIFPDILLIYPFNYGISNGIRYSVTSFFGIT